MRALGLGDNLAELRATITDWKPDVAFNLLEEFQGIVTYDQYVVAFLELMKLPYTGCNPRGMMISRDKALSKQILSYHRIPTPGFAVFRKGQRYRLPRKLKFPLFVKSVTEDASLGISQASVVSDAEQAQGAHRVHPRADQLRRAGRGVHRRPRAVRRRARQRSAAHVPGLGDGFRHAARRHGRHRDAQGEVGSALSEEARHPHRRGAGAARRLRGVPRQDCRSASIARCH